MQANLAPDQANSMRWNEQGSCWDLPRRFVSLHVALRSCPSISSALSVAPPNLGPGGGYSICCVCSNGSAVRATTSPCTCGFELHLCPDLTRRQCPNSQVRPAGEEEPHEMNQKGEPQLASCIQPWQPSRFGISLIDPSVRCRNSYAMSILSILCP